MIMAPLSLAVPISLLLLSLPCREIGAIKLDIRFFDLFSLVKIYDEVKYGDIPHLRDTFLSHHLSENTAKLLYALARAFVRAKVNTKAEFLAKPFMTSVVKESICNNEYRYNSHRLPDVACHFQIFTICVAGVLEKPSACLQPKPDPACAQATTCTDVYNNVLAEEPRAWLQLWSEETMDNLLKYQNYTAAEIAALPRKSCLHDSQFLSAIFNLALCSEISRQVALTDPRILHSLGGIYCPDPCLRSPCDKSTLKHQLTNSSCSTRSIQWEMQHAIAHRWDDLQLQRQHGIRPMYTCNCRKGFVWVVSKEACQRSEGGSMQTCSPTVANKHFPCSSEGTSVCYDNKESEEVPFICRCKQGYFGIFCQDRLNACVHVAFNIEVDGKMQRMTGNRMCNVNHGGEAIANASAPTNECSPDPDGRNGYSCNCTAPYFTLISLETANCLGVKRACDDQLCVTGDCISTPDLMSAGICRCGEGWGGDHCDRMMADWGVWSACRPICGANRTRMRERRGDQLRAGRLFVEMELCQNRYCRDDADDAEYSAYQTLLYASSVDSVALTVSILIALLSFSVLRFWRPRFVSREARIG